MFFIVKILYRYIHVCVNDLGCDQRKWAVKDFTKSNEDLKHANLWKIICVQQLPEQKNPSGRSCPPDPWVNDTWRSWYHVFVAECDYTTWYMMIHGDPSLYVIIHDDTAWSDHTCYMMLSWFRLFCSQFQEQVLKRCITEVAMALLEQSSNLSVWQVDRQTLPPKIVEFDDIVIMISIIMQSCNMGQSASTLLLVAWGAFSYLKISSQTCCYLSLVQVFDWSDWLWKKHVRIRWINQANCAVLFNFMDMYIDINLYTARSEWDTWRNTFGTVNASGSEGSADQSTHAKCWRPVELNQTATSTRW